MGSLKESGKEINLVEKGKRLHEETKKVGSGRPITDQDIC